MSEERRYSEEAIAEIFRQAAEAQADARNRASAADGLTLEEIQEIGAEAGLSPEFIQRAAARLETQATEEPAPTLLGMPVGVARTVQLPGKMTEEEWHALVVDLRRTFNAKGRLHESAAFKEWSNGNLHIMLEPSGEGQQLRMRTFKQSARDLLMAGVGLSTISLVGMLILLLTGAEFLESFATMPVLGAGVLMALFGFMQIPGWARTRAQQMEDIGRRAVERTQEREAPASARAGGEKEAPEIDQDLLDEAATEAGGATASQRRSRA